MTRLEQEFRSLVQRAWSSEGSTQLAIELEATAYRCLGINLDAERRARLAECDRRRALPPSTCGKCGRSLRTVDGRLACVNAGCSNYVEAFA